MPPKRQPALRGCFLVLLVLAIVLGAAVSQFSPEELLRSGFVPLLAIGCLTIGWFIVGVFLVCFSCLVVNSFLRGSVKHKPIVVPTGSEALVIMFGMGVVNIAAGGCGYLAAALCRLAGNTGPVLALSPTVGFIVFLLLSLIGNAGLLSSLLSKLEAPVNFWQGLYVMITFQLIAGIAATPFLVGLFYIARNPMLLSLAVS